ncbi:MAG: prolipoprotein diacylglyceryl transferase, partial [Lachnospiraceae bacterium]|nr:prolipoprotein diacylglyceryl transferase [Lachnospiraceae bacterium]
IMVYCRKWRRRFEIWKLAISAILLTVSGALGAVLLYYVENGKFGGISFYGSLFVIPVLFLLVALVLKIPYPDLMDLCAPCVSLMLAINKVNCIWSGCCKGIVLMVHSDGSAVRFPSQIVELLVALAITGLLLWLMSKVNYRKLLYPVFLVVYGVTRFGLNWLRETSPFLFGLPAGHIWSIVSVLIGAIWILIAVAVRKKHGKQ